MNRKKTIIIALALAAALGAASIAVAQSMQHKGPGMPGGMGMHGGTNMQDGMKGCMQGDMKGCMGMKGGMGMQDGMKGGMQMQGAPAGDESVASLAFAAANEKMHRGMAITFTGNPDADFVGGMIPHHQGAIDMAKIVIAFGKDLEIKKLAEEIVKAQETEIAFMQAWLKKQGK